MTRIGLAAALLTGCSATNDDCEDFRSGKAGQALRDGIAQSSSDPNAAAARLELARRAANGSSGEHFAVLAEAIRDYRTVTLAGRDSAVVADRLSEAIADVDAACS
ncbi:MAG: hypothetical protein M3P85_00530 [Actinomycetota bacterium]|nr:hypothetical protein [Actinomycetota bacterium]